MVASAMSGKNQRRNGPMNREVCSADIKSVEPTKITASQIKTGSQYLRKNRMEAPVSFALTNLQPTICNQ